MIGGMRSLTGMLIHSTQYIMEINLSLIHTASERHSIIWQTSDLEWPTSTFLHKNNVHFSTIKGSL